MLEIYEAVTHADAEVMRGIRNSCRQYMTNNRNLIQSDEQLEWFVMLDRGAMRPYLFVLGGTHVGYGIIKLDDGVGLLTGGLVPAYRGLGYGTQLFSLLIEECSRWNIPPALEVLKTNDRAIVTYKKLGFAVISQTDKIYKMELL